MNTRIQQVLDGELARTALGPEELHELDQAEQTISRVLAGVPVRPIPDLSTAVLSRIPPAKSRFRDFVVSWFRWFTAPTLQLRPAYVLGAFVLMAIGFGVLTRSSVPRAASSKVLIEFRFDAPNARQVSLAGDFTNWQPGIKLNRSEPGVWTVVVPLNPGVHDYAFIVDGERWTPDPKAPAVPDGFGGMNSRLAVLAPENNRSM